MIDQFFAAFRFLGNSGTKFYFVSNYEAPRYRVIEVDITKPERSNWRTLVAETQDTLHAAELVKGVLVIGYMHDVSGKVVRMKLADPASARTLPLPANSTISIGTRSTDIFTATSFTAPSTIYRCDDTACKPVFDVKLPFDISGIESRQVFYPSKDGTKIPMYLVHPQGPQD